MTDMTETTGLDGLAGIEGDATQPLGERWVVSSKGFSAHVHQMAFADRNVASASYADIYYMSVLGPKEAVRAVMGNMLSANPGAMQLERVGGEHSLFVQETLFGVIAPSTRGAWTAPAALRLPCGAYQQLIYTRLAQWRYIPETESEDADAGRRGSFTLLASDAGAAPDMYGRFLSEKLPIPIHDSWSDALWEEAVLDGSVTPLRSYGDVKGYLCAYDADVIRERVTLLGRRGILERPVPARRRG